jgi:alcohol dehydrogenase class IV
MNILKKIYCRTFQLGFRLALPFLPYRQPKILENNVEVVDLLKNENLSKAFFVTDKTIKGLGLTQSLEEELTKNNIEVIYFDEVVPNPTISVVKQGLIKYNQNNCDCIIALGGGSVIDCAKTIGARVVRPNKSVKQMKGLLKICKKLPTFIAIPTTAGTGSETTLAAVITDDETHHKYPINDFSLIPHYALLDYNLTLGLNQKITSTTGMDALTHSVEAYIGQSTTPQTRRAAIESIILIKDNLTKVYDNGQDKEARQKMLKASFLAGVAFTKSYVGYIHAIAHTLGGKYGVPHGLANAIILPIMLRHYGKSIFNKLGKLAKLTNIALPTDNNEVASEKFISFIEQLNDHFNIPNYIEQLQEEDIPYLSTIANKEANPLYPVPQLMDEKELQIVYKKLLKK